MVDQSMLQNLVGRIYDAAVNPEQWPPFLDALAESMTRACRNPVAHSSCAR
jgi:hypothetical protein